MINYTPKFIEYVQENGKNFTSRQRELINEQVVKNYVKNYLSTHTFFSARNVALDFIFNKLKYKGWISSRNKSNPFRKLVKKLQTYVTRAILPTLIEKGVLMKFNTRNYKIDPTIDTSLIEL